MVKNLPKRPTDPAAYMTGVLVLERDADVRLFVVETLRDQHYDVRDAGDVVTAQGILTGSPETDLLLCDATLLDGTTEFQWPMGSAACRCGFYSRRGLIIHQWSETGEFDPACSSCLSLSARTR